MSPVDERSARFRAAIEALAQAHQEASRLIERQSNADLAYEDVRELANTVQKLSEATTNLRLDVVGRIWDNEQMSLAVLADRIGVSKARADQLIRAKHARVRDIEAGN